MASLLEAGTTVSEIAVGILVMVLRFVAQGVRRFYMIGWARALCVQPLTDVGWSEYHTSLSGTFRAAEAHET